jgi:hypothetical protein
MSDFNWAPYGLLPQAVDEALIDGFFVPHDWGVKPPRTWPGGKALISISTPKGWHLIADGTWQNYGYPTLGSFTEALRAGRAMCKTQAGIVSLGLSRFVPGQRIICTAAGIIADRTMEFIAGNQADLALLEQFIHEHFPGASVASRAAGWTGQLSAGGTFNIKEMTTGFSALGATQKIDISLILATGLLSVLGTLLALFGLLSIWVSIISIAGFAAAASVAMIRAARPSDREGKESRGIRRISIPPRS